MFSAEAAWLQREMSRFGPEALSPLLHLGSSDTTFRMVTQPWIHERIERPLRQAGTRIVNVDLKPAEGVDIVGDILDDRVIARLRALAPRAILCANVLEHVADPRAFARRCLDVLPPSGLIFITVPRSYPHHADPIDTMFRPSPGDVHALFPGTDLVRAEIIAPGSYRDDLRRRPWIVLRFLRLLAPFLSLARWRRTASKLYWVFKPYEVSCVVLRKAPA